MEAPGGDHVQAHAQRTAAHCGGATAACLALTVAGCNGGLSPEEVDRRIAAAVEQAKAAPAPAAPAAEAAPASGPVGARAVADDPVEGQENAKLTSPPMVPRRASRRRARRRSSRSGC
jgi:hypothetical protein